MQKPARSRLFWYLVMLLWIFQVVECLKTDRSFDQPPQMKYFVHPLLHDSPQVIERIQILLNEQNRSGLVSMKQWYTLRETPLP